MGTELNREAKEMNPVLQVPGRPIAAGGAHGEEIWRIGDLAKEFDLTLRFYEDKGLLTPWQRGSSRLYSRRDKARLKLIVLGRKIGFSVQEIKQMIDLYELAGGNARQLEVALQKATKQMERLITQRDAIAEAIGDLSKTMKVVRDQLGETRYQEIQ